MDGCRFAYGSKADALSERLLSNLLIASFLRSGIHFTDHHDNPGSDKKEALTLHPVL